MKFVCILLEVKVVFNVQVLKPNVSFDNGIVFMGLVPRDSETLIPAKL